MSQTNLHPMLNIAVKAARAGGAIISRASQDLDRLTVTSKGHNDFVTEVDQAAEYAIIDTILQAYPGHAILAEESGREHGAKHSDYVWIIDPLDGTTNFIHGLPQYAVSIALAYKGRVEQAVVYDPTRNDLFYATKGKGAFLNDKRLRVSKRTRLLDCLIGTGFPFRKGDNFKRYMKMFEEVMQACAGVRRPGSAALDLCYVAAGWYDGFFETGLNPWDIAAGSLIITEAGGLVGNFTGEADYLYQRELVTGSPRIYAQLVQILAPYTRVIKEDEAEADTDTDSGASTATPSKTARTPKASKTPVSAATSASFAGTISATSSMSPASRAASVDEPDEADEAAEIDDGAEEVWAEPKRASTASERPMTPAQALAAAFNPTPVDTVAPTVTVRKPTRIRKADLPAPVEEERRPAPRGPKRHDDAPF
jgi:myo-inositol-1(or 4)-monophosphatase